MRLTLSRQNPCPGQRPRSADLGHPNILCVQTAVSSVVRSSGLCGYSLNRESSKGLAVVKAKGTPCSCGQAAKMRRTTRMQASPRAVPSHQSASLPWCLLEGRATHGWSWQKANGTGWCFTHGGDCSFMHWQSLDAQPCSDPSSRTSSRVAKCESLGPVITRCGEH